MPCSWKIFLASHSYKFKTCSSIWERNHSLCGCAFLYPGRTVRVMFEHRVGGQRRFSCLQERDQPQLPALASYKCRSFWRRSPRNSEKLKNARNKPPQFCSFADIKARPPPTLNGCFTELNPPFPLSVPISVISAQIKHAPESNKCEGR